MKEYTVEVSRYVRETATVKVQANSEAEAIQKVREMYDLDEIEFSTDYEAIPELGDVWVRDEELLEEE